MIGVTFTQNTTEILSEYLYFNNSEYGMYYYGVIDGTKYYYEGTKPNQTQPADDDKIFYIDDSGSKHDQFSSYKNNKEQFQRYYDKIFRNNSAYEYYRDSYNFTSWVETNLANLDISHIDTANTSFADYDFVDVGKIFDGNMQYSNSNFNAHRRDIIRATISTNLQTAITGFSKYSSSGEEFLMPKITENDWDLLENNICIASFLQGLRVGGKVYNSCCVIPNNFNKEYVDENDIYILKNDHTYARANDRTLNNSNILPKSALRYEPGNLKINFERKHFAEGNYFNPISYENGTNANGTKKYDPYLASYTSIVGGIEVNSLDSEDMYEYIGKTTIPTRLKEVYYTALGRERASSFKYTKNDM